MFSHLRVLGVFARVNSSSLSRPLRLCESLFLIPLCVLCVSARVHSQSLSLRSQRLCESPLPIPIFAFSASLRESTPHPYLRALSAFARVNSSSLSRPLRLCESLFLIPLCVLCVSARTYSSPLSLRSLRICVETNRPFGMKLRKISGSTGPSNPDVSLPSEADILQFEKRCEARPTCRAIGAGRQERDPRRERARARDQAVRSDNTASRAYRFEVSAEKPGKDGLFLARFHNPLTSIYLVQFSRNR